MKRKDSNDDMRFYSVVIFRTLSALSRKLQRLNDSYIRIIQNRTFESNENSKFGDYYFYRLLFGGRIRRNPPGRSQHLTSGP